MDLNKNGNTGNTFKKYCITMKFNCKRNYLIFLYFVWIFLVNNMMVDKIWWNLSSPVLIIYPMSLIFNLYRTINFKYDLWISHWWNLKITMHLF